MSEISVKVRSNFEVDTLKTIPHEARVNTELLIGWQLADKLVTLEGWEAFKDKVDTAQGLFVLAVEQAINECLKTPVKTEPSVVEDENLPEELKAVIKELNSKGFGVNVIKATPQDIQQLPEELQKALKSGEKGGFVAEVEIPDTASTEAQPSSAAQPSPAAQSFEGYSREAKELLKGITNKTISTSEALVKVNDILGAMCKEMVGLSYDEAQERFGGNKQPEVPREPHNNLITCIRLDTLHKAIDLDELLTGRKGKRVMSGMVAKALFEGMAVAITYKDTEVAASSVYNLISTMDLFSSMSDDCKEVFHENAEVFLKFMDLTEKVSKWCHAQNVANS